MKRLMLSDAERRTLRDMGIFHPHPRARMRAQGILRLSQGLTLQETADEFDESGFSPNPSLQYGWSRIGETRSVEPLAHRQRVNVLGALRHDGQLIWTTQQRPTRREDVIAFFDQIADQLHSVPRIVLLDNAAIHKRAAMEKKRRRWARHGLHLYYLPPYSPELNRIEIVWKHAKYFWRRFVAKNGAALLDEIRSLMKGFGTGFTVNFA
jgi:transposase